MSDYDYARHYKNMCDKLYAKYGTEHLCGSCVHTTTCKRADIQWLNNKNIKRGLMEKIAPFVKHFEIEPMIRYQKDAGFVAVYDCDRFEFDGYKRREDDGNEEEEE